MEEKNSTEVIGSKILYLRKKQVMLSQDLAKLYQIEPRVLNQAVKRNKERFPEHFCFQLNSDEMKNLKSQFVISSWGGIRANPYAFTEQGVAMLSAVLKSERAIKVSIEIMDAFVQMRHLLRDNQTFIGTNEILSLANQTSQNALDIAKNTGDIARLSTEMHENRDALRKVMDNFLDPSTFKHFLILDGQKLEADIAYTQIYGQAQNTIVIVDNYVGHQDF